MKMQDEVAMHGDILEETAVSHACDEFEGKIMVTLKDVATATLEHCRQYLQQFH